MASAQALKKQEQLEAGKRRVRLLISTVFFLFFFCVLILNSLGTFSYRVCCLLLKFHLCHLLYVYIFYLNLCMSFSVRVFIC